MAGEPLTKTFTLDINYLDSFWSNLQTYTIGSSISFLTSSITEQAQLNSSIVRQTTATAASTALNPSNSSSKNTTSIAKKLATNNKIANTASIATQAAKVAEATNMSEMAANMFNIQSVSTSAILKENVTSVFSLKSTDLAIFVQTNRLLSDPVLTADLLLGTAEYKINPLSIDPATGQVKIAITCTKITFGMPIVRAIKLTYEYEEIINEDKKYCNRFINNQNFQDAFREFTPYICGDYLIPEDTYNFYKKVKIDEETEEWVRDDINYQKYPTDPVILKRNNFIEPITAGEEGILGSGFKINGKEIKGCKIGTVPIAGEGHNLLESAEIIRIWKEDSSIKYCLKQTISSEWSSTRTLIAPDMPNNIHRLGVLLIGAGGGGGGYTSYKYDKKRKQGYYKVPGTGGGGGGLLWGVINIDKSSQTHPFYITPGIGGAQGYAGNATELYYEDILLAKAGGGSRGFDGNNGGQQKFGTGGTNYINDADGIEDYFVLVSNQRGGDSAGYDKNLSEVIVPANEIQISFLEDETNEHLITTIKTNPVLRNSGSIEDWAKFAVPGGNSWGHGANVQEKLPATIGGGGAGIETAIWDPGDTRKELAAGANGYWILFY